MKSQITSMLLLVVCLWMYGCEQSVEKNKSVNSTENINVQKEHEGENDNMNKVDNVDFKNIGQALETEEIKPINEVVILFFSEWSNDNPSDAIAINIVDNKIYVNPSLSLHRFSTFDKEIQIKESEAVLNILKKFEVQTWKRDYSFEEKDSYEGGVSWKLWLQFEDGTVERHGGSGTSKEEITPDNFKKFALELQNFVQSAIK